MTILRILRIDWRKTMSKYVFGGIIRPSEDGGYWAEVPDLPGCFAQGNTYMDAVESLSDGVETHLAALTEYGMPIPKAEPVEASDGDVVYIYANTDGMKLGVPTVSAAEAARMLEVTPGRVSQLIKLGRLVAERSASGTQVTLDSIEALQATSRSAGRPKKAAAV